MTLISVLFLTGEALAEEDEEPIEEITAYGKKNLLNLKFAALQAEQDFFNRFNELNEIDEFDVFCGKEASTYSRIRRWTCWSPFERQYDEDRARYAFQTGARVGSRNEGEIRAKRKQQAEHLLQIVLENPELQTLYVRYGEANVEYQAERDKRCAGKLVCGDSAADEKDHE